MRIWKTKDEDKEGKKKKIEKGGKDGKFCH